MNRGTTNDIDLERLRETEIALRFNNLGYFKTLCLKCQGLGYEGTLQEYILNRVETMTGRFTYPIPECDECRGTGHVWSPRETVSIVPEEVASP